MAESALPALLLLASHELRGPALLTGGRIKVALKRTSLRSVLNQAVQAVELPGHFATDLDVVAPTDVRLRLDEARMRVVFCTLIATLARVQSGAAGFDLRLVKGRTTAQVVVQPRTLGRGTLEERPVDISRGGTGRQLPIAIAVVQAHGGRLHERWLAGKFAGFVVEL
ncbi:MAG: hypothetical protein RJA55_2610 [Acidobacteriota bacterium]|jgi:signal transduction histidine kinase